MVRQWLLWGLWGLQKESEIKLVMVLTLAGLLVQWRQKRHVWIFSDCFSNPHCPQLPISSVCGECIFKWSQILFQVLTVLTVITVLLTISLMRTVRTPKKLEKKLKRNIIIAKQLLLLGQWGLQKQSKEHFKKSLPLAEFLICVVRTVRTPKRVRDKSWLCFYPKQGS